jgi:UDP-2,3-diacylglucosamine pyrophosphatase LpxH
MGQRKVTVVVSDLHIGGGPQDPGDDFIYQANQFPRMVQELGSTPEGSAGQIELIINGDFLELAQTEPNVYKLDSAKYWCTEAESMRKLESILKGHTEIFEAIDAFQTRGNAVTIMPGNHDIDLCWAGVRERIRRAVRGVEFETGTVWLLRYGGRMRISHGNQLDPANRFEHWDNPVLLADYAEKRLEMCPGTLFMVRFVNWLEKRYPFADNLHPVTRLAGILAKESRFGLAAASWMLARFAARYPVDFLGKEPSDGLRTGKQLLEAIRYDSRFRARLTEVYREVREEPGATEESVAKALGSEAAMADFMADSMAAIEMETWTALFDMAQPDILNLSDDSGDTLAIIQSGKLAEDTWRREAEEQWRQGAEVVVFGHTHLPETMRQGRRAYYNPGSWTRYVRSEDLAGLTMEDLKQEDKFPYQLNYVQVTETEQGGLDSSMICFEERTSFR